MPNLASDWHFYARSSFADSETLRMDPSSRLPPALTAGDGKPVTQNFYPTPPARLGRIVGMQSCVEGAALPADGTAHFLRAPSLFLYFSALRTS